MAGRYIIDLSYLILMSFSSKWNDLKHALSRFDMHIGSTNATAVMTTAWLTFNIGFIFSFSRLLFLSFSSFAFFPSLLCLNRLILTSFLLCSFICSCRMNLSSFSFFLSFSLIRHVVRIMSNVKQEVPVRGRRQR